MKRPLLASLAMLAAPALCQLAPALGQAPPLRCEDKVHRQFDFWLGEWEVFDPEGKRVGDSSITSAEKGCLIVERWMSAKGNSGQSYNFYDTDRQQWRQVWVSPFELTDYAGALNAKGEMVLEGVAQQAGGAKQRSLGTWTANADGTVTQTFKIWDETKGAWVEDFVGVYRRKR